MSKISIAFYKKETTFKESKFDSLIRWWTRSPFSHTEIIIDGVWYTSSPIDGGVRIKRLKSNPKNWTFLTLDLTDDQIVDIKSFFINELGKKYDVLGILFSQVIYLGVNDKSKWFCSEICLAALQESGFLSDEYDPALFAPSDLFNLLLKEHADKIIGVM